jgi:hypothetical protein
MNIKLYYGKVGSSIGRKTSFEKKIKRFIQYTDDLHVITIILTKFINSGNGVNIYFDNEDDSVKQYLTRNYSKLVEFGSLVKTFLPPVRETTNVDLQTLIDNFSHGYLNKEDSTESLEKTSSNEEEKLLERVIDEKQHVSELFKYRNTNVCIVEKDKKRFFEIYLHIDVVEGVITSNNMSSIKCSFQSNDMTSRLKNLISNKQLSQYRIVAKPQVDINSILEQNKKKQESAKQKTNQSTTSLSTSALKNGGRKKQKTYKRKKYYKIHNKTHRKYK